MNIDQKIQSLAKLGSQLTEFTNEESEIFREIQFKNKWFIKQFLKNSISGIQILLDQNNLNRWVSNYIINETPAKDIGIIMAGNIPAVGFHDLLSVVLTGNRAIIKLSHNDDIIIPYILDILFSNNPEFKKLIKFSNSLTKIDALIATGSDNTARYFRYNFKAKPCLIRKNRSSCAVLTGLETSADLASLSSDVFLYFGLGCRNVSKIYLPENFDLHRLVSAFKSYKWIETTEKYKNNYIYQKTLLSMTKEYHINGDFFILMPSNQLVSPIATVYYEYYSDLNSLENQIQIQENKIQCIVSKKGWYPKSIAFSEAQKPFPWDYSDHVDTIQFLLDL